MNCKISIEEAKKRNEFSAKLLELADYCKGVPSTGRDIPITHIEYELRHWADSYKIKIGNGGAK